MAEDSTPLVGAYVPSTQDVVLHIPRTLWEQLPREGQEEGPVGELLAAVWATPGLDAVLGQAEAPPPPTSQTETPPEPQTTQQTEGGDPDAPA